MKSLSIAERDVPLFCANREVTGANTCVECRAGKAERPTWLGKGNSLKSRTGVAGSGITGVASLVHRRQKGKESHGTLSNKD